MADQRSIHDAVFTMRYNMQEGKANALDRAISRLENQSLGDHEIERILRKHADEITAWLDTFLRSGTVSNKIMDQVMHLVELPARWPSLIELIKRNRDAVIRYILVQLKEAMNEDLSWMIDEITGWCDKLLNLGMDWPEIGAIRKSMESEANRRWDVQEQTNHPPLMRWAEDEIRDKILRYRKQPGPLAIRRLTNDLSGYNLTKYEIERFVSPMRDAIIYDLRSKLESGKFVIPINDMISLANLDLLDDGMRSLLDASRDGIIRNILKMVREDGINSAYLMVENLWKLGVRWPELDVIARSHGAEYSRQKWDQERV